MKRYKLDFILEDRVQEDMNDAEMPTLSHERLLDVLFQTFCNLPVGLRIARGTMSIREIEDGRLQKQLVRRN